MPELLLYTPKVTQRVSYIFQLFFDSLIRTSYSITNDEAIFNAYTGPKLNYSSTSFPNGRLQIIPYGLLIEEGMRPQSISLGEWNKLKFFFGSDRGSLPFD